MYSSLFVIITAVKSVLQVARWEESIYNKRERERERERETGDRGALYYRQVRQEVGRSQVWPSANWERRESCEAVRCV